MFQNISPKLFLHFLWPDVIYSSTSALAVPSDVHIVQTSGIFTSRTPVLIRQKESEVSPLFQLASVAKA